MLQFGKPMVTHHHIEHSVQDPFQNMEWKIRAYDVQAYIYTDLK
jgi:hypothetical protein